MYKQSDIKRSSLATGHSKYLVTDNLQRFQKLDKLLQKELNELQRVDCHKLKYKYDG